MELTGLNRYLTILSLLLLESSLISKRLLVNWKNWLVKICFMMMESATQSRSMLTILHHWVTKRETSRIHFITILLSLATKMESPISQVLISMELTSRKIGLLLDFQSTMDWHSLLTIGIPIELLRNANKFCTDAGLSFMREIVIQLIKFSLLLWLKKVLRYCLLSMSTQIGISKISTTGYYLINMEKLQKRW